MITWGAAKLSISSIASVLWKDMSNLQSGLSVALCGIIN